MDHFSVRALPIPVPDQHTLLEYSARLKALRLKSLKHDTGSFISKYESEVNEPPEFWLKRLTDPRAVHLVLCRHDSDDPSDTIQLTLLRSQWVGFVVIIAPDRNKDEAAAPTVPEWQMAALYVEAEVRGQSLGKRLVQATMDYIRNNSSSSAGSPPFCMTSVRHGNDLALQLYQKLGFRVVDANEQVEKEGRQYTATMLRIDL